MLRSVQMIWAALAFTLSAMLELWPTPWIVMLAVWIGFWGLSWSSLLLPGGLSLRKWVADKYLAWLFPDVALKRAGQQWRRLPREWIGKQPIRLLMLDVDGFVTDIDGQFDFPLRFKAPHMCVDFAHTDYGYIMYRRRHTTEWQLLDTVWKIQYRPNPLAFAQLVQLLRQRFPQKHQGAAADLARHIWSFLSQEKKLKKKPT